MTLQVNTYLDRYLTCICSNLFLAKLYISPLDFRILTIYSEEQRIDQHVIKLKVPKDCLPTLTLFPLIMDTFYHLPLTKFYIKLIDFSSLTICSEE